jgi:hypothetical protein
MEDELEATRRQALRWLNEESDIAIQDLPTRKRYATLAGLILWAARQQKDDPNAPAPTGTLKEQTRQFLDRVKVPEVVARLKDAFNRMHAKSDKPLVWTISLNRRVHPALTRSVPAVKADAARTLFTVDCKEIVWAVIDSGIDATHLAFRDRVGGASRVLKTFDFTRIRDIVTLDNLVDSDRRKQRINRILAPPPLAQASRAVTLKHGLQEKDVVERLEGLARGAEEGRPIDWRLVEQLVELDPAQSPPATNHGTHVAGILGACGDAARAVIAAARAEWEEWQKPKEKEKEKKKDKAREKDKVRPSTETEELARLDPSVWADGMCPDIRLYDFRVLAPTLRETEFAVIGALQYIRHINERNSWMTIHGANLSLSIPHDVRNYACGRTPVCNECERLVGSGVVVVAAAGNRGYQNFETSEGLYEGYAAFSVTDPGNADGVVTVGATHRYWPHTYGVSFFSSRGPTGDGRLKPDLVAPGERIRAPIPANEWGDPTGRAWPRRT